MDTSNTRFFLNLRDVLRKSLAMKGLRHLHWSQVPQAEALTTNSVGLVGLKASKECRTRFGSGDGGFPIISIYLPKKLEQAPLVALAPLNFDFTKEKTSVGLSVGLHLAPL
jgi:hypothetical protein